MTDLWFESLIAPLLANAIERLVVVWGLLKTTGLSTTLNESGQRRSAFWQLRWLKSMWRYPPKAMMPWPLSSVVRLLIAGQPANQRDQTCV